MSAERQTPIPSIVRFPRSSDKDHGRPQSFLPPDFTTPPLDSGSYFIPDLITVPSPPEELPAHNTYPPEEWRFSDQAEPGFQDEIVEREPFESAEVEEKLVLNEEDRRHIMEAIQASDQVRERLGGRRHTFIGASLRNSPPKPETSPLVEVVAYDYDQDTTLLVQLESLQELTVESIETTRYLPTPTVEEVRQAVDLARSSAELADRGVEEMEVGVLRDFSHISESGDVEGDTGRRRLDVRFSQRVERKFCSVRLF